MDLQHTLANPATLAGRGLFSGHPVTATFRPAPENHGVVFIRTDLARAAIPALVTHVVKRPRRTALKSGEAFVETTEHCLSALAGLGIDNAAIEIDGPELPGLDGSAKPYVEALLAAGVKPQAAARRRLVITEPVVVQQDDAIVAAVPSPGAAGPGMQVLYDLDYGRHPVVGRQLATYDSNRDSYAQEIAPARTFVLEAEARAMFASGMGAHLTPMDVVVLGDAGPIGGNALRFANEPARHKLLDLLGDLSLLGAPIQGRITAYKSGHALNAALVRRLIAQQQRLTRGHLALHRNVLDVRGLMRMFRHRYPMLLVDRVIEIDSDRRALGVKNVTMNEPFFQGHFPGTPIMPGVLVVEAMAQLSGVLIAQKAENMGKLAVLLSLDRVKLRRPVVPGDQLLLEAESVRVRPRLAHMRCRAYVGEDLAAEAEVKFGIVEDEES